MKSWNFTVSWIKAGVLEMKNQHPAKRDQLFFHFFKGVLEKSQGTQYPKCNHNTKKKKIL